MTPRLSRRRVASWLAAAFVAACANNGERPPPPVCAGDCGPAISGGVGFPSTPNGGASSEGEAGAPGQGQAVTLTGNVELVLDNGRFDTVQIFADNAAINTTDVDGKPSLGTWNGGSGAQFTLGNLAAKDTAWILVTPEKAAAVDAVPTYEPVLTSPVDAMGEVVADLALVRDSNIETIFDTLSVPVQRDTSAAQVVLRIVKKRTTTGIAGVTVRAPVAAAVVYGANAGYSDVATTTDATGVVVLLNVPAAKYPGALVSIQASGAISAGAQVRAVGGAVTLANVAF